jgi:hypothetical protein
MEDTKAGLASTAQRLDLSVPLRTRGPSPPRFISRDALGALALPHSHHGAEVVSTAQGAVFRGQHGLLERPWGWHLPADPRIPDEHATRLEGQDNSQKEGAHCHLDLGPLDDLVCITGPWVGTLGLATGAGLGCDCDDLRGTTSAWRCPGCPARQSGRSASHAADRRRGNNRHGGSAAARERRAGRSARPVAG